MEHAFRRAYCELNSSRALAPEVNQVLTSVAEAGTSSGSQVHALKACSTPDRWNTISNHRGAAARQQLIPLRIAFGRQLEAEHELVLAGDLEINSPGAIGSDGGVDVERAHRDRALRLSLLHLH